MITAATNAAAILERHRPAPTGDTEPATAAARPEADVDPGHHHADRTDPVRARYPSENNLTAGGPDRLIALGKHRRPARAATTIHQRTTTGRRHRDRPDATPTPNPPRTPGLQTPRRHRRNRHRPPQRPHRTAHLQPPRTHRRHQRTPPRSRHHQPPQTPPHHHLHHLAPRVQAPRGSPNPTTPPTHLPPPAKPFPNRLCTAGSRRTTSHRHGHRPNRQPRAVSTPGAWRLATGSAWSSANLIRHPSAVLTPT